MKNLYAKICYLFICLFILSSFKCFSQNYQVSVTGSDPETCESYGVAIVTIVESGQAGYHVAGGGGGWYGGGSAFAAGGGGGSSYIGGVVSGTTQSGIRNGDGIMNITYNDVTKSFSFTGAPQVFIVPDGVTRIFIEAWGAQGGDAWSCSGNYDDEGGLGGFASGYLNVSSGETYYVYVGGAGFGPTAETYDNDGGWNGGGDGNRYGAGGGGATDLRSGLDDLNSRIIVAGGGGGSNEGCPNHGAGGAGGGLTGLDGIGTGTYNPGLGGTQIAGGEAGFKGKPGGYGYGGEFLEVGDADILWSTGETTNVISNLTPGTYSVLVTEPGGYRHDLSVTINNPDGIICNTPPVISDIDDVLACPNTTVNSIPFVIGDNEDDPSKLILTVVSSNQYLVPDENITISGNSENREITIVPEVGVTGITTVSVIVEDEDGGTDQTAFLLTVDDKDKPVVSVQDITVYLDQSGMVILDSLAVDDGSSDACGLAGFELSQDTFDCSNVGANLVTLTVTDVNKNIAQSTSIVTVLDTVSPVIECSDILVESDADRCGANVYYNKIIFSADFTTGEVSTSCDDWQAFRASLLPEYAYEKLTIRGSFDNEGVSVTDEEKVLQIANALRMGTEVTLTDNGRDWRVGTCGVGIELSAAGSICLCPSDEYIVRPCIGNYNWGGAGTSTCSGPTQTITVEFEIAHNIFDEENCDIESVVYLPEDGSFLPVGETKVLKTVTDQSGNTSQCEFTVTVEDHTNPVALAHDTTLFLDVNGIATITAEGIDAGSYDNCNIDTMYLSQDTFNSDDLGYRSVALTVVDIHGNEASKTAQITVRDTISPTLTIPADISVYADADQCGTIVNYQEEALDVSQPTYTTGIAGMLKSQSFRAVENGKLTRIQLFKNGVGAYEITLSIYNGDGLSGEVLYSANYSIDYSTNGWFDLNIPVEDAPFLTAGDDYTFSLSNDDINLLISDDNPYAFGRFFSSGYPSNLTHDLMFRTYITDGVFANDNANGVELEQKTGLPSGSVFPVGETTNTFVATDIAGNKTEKSFKVTVEDNTKPTVVAHNKILYLDAEGIAALTSGSIDNGSYDNCEIDTMYLSQNTFNCDDIGTGNVTLTVVDIYGNQASKSAQITVRDTISPEVKTKDITVYLDESGMIVLDSLATDNGSSDACGLANFELSQDTFYCENVGENTVSLTVTDIHGNVAVGSSTITVVDNRLPVIMTQDTTLYINADGIATISVESIDAGSYDNCSIDTMYLSQDTFDCRYVGYVPEDNLIGLKSAKVRRPDGYPVWLTAIDANGNIAQDLFYVAVDDTIAPEVTTKDITVYLDESGMVVLDSLAVDNGSNDACGLARIELSRDTFYCENVGKNTVTMTVTDIHGNVSSATATVTIADEIRPTVLASDTTLYLNAYGIATISVESIDAGSYDNCGIDTMYLSQDTFDCSYVGYVPEDNLIGLKNAKVRRPSGFAVWLTAIDVNGNTGSDIFYVTVEDTIAPEAITKDIVISLGEDGIETISTDMVVEESYDACGVESLELSQSTFKGTDVGANKIVITATDVNGNQSFYTSVVTVRDTIAPELWCQNFSIILDEEGSARIYPSFALDSTYDAGGIASYSLDENKFNCTDIGENIVTLTVKDYGGNAASCTSAVNVVDVMEPEVLCKDIEVALNAQGFATIDPTMVDAGSSDICGIAEMSLSKSEFTGADLGKNQVDLLVTDKSGNTASCTATITVTDEIAPEVTCNAISIGLLSGTYELTNDDIAALTAGSYDNATPFDSLIVEVSPNTFSCEDIGDSVLVTVSVRDEAGNTGVCETKVYVDFPVIEELADVETTLAAGSCEGTVDYPEVFTSETCATMTLVEGLGADGVFPIGTTTETWAIVAGSITDTVSFNVEVKAENALPTLDSVADVAANEDEVYVMQLTGISDGGDCVAQELSVTATSVDTDLIADIAVDYTSPDSTAELSITLVANESGEAEIVVTVEDEAGAAVTDTFTITVSAVNDAPVLVEQLADQEVRAGSTLELILSKTLGVLFDDIDNDELNWSATLLEADTIPSWISIDESAEDYVIGFSPAESDTGCYSIVVAVQDADGAEATDTFEVCITGTPVGIEEIGTTSFEVKMYPNPTRGKVNVEYDVISPESIEITVHSAAGGEVFRKEYNSGEAIRFDLSGEVSGMYLVIIRQGDRQISKKLILDRQ